MTSRFGTLRATEQILGLSIRILMKFVALSHRFVGLSSRMWLKSSGFGLRIVALAIEMPQSKRSAGISCSRALIEDSIEESGLVLIEEEHCEESLSSLL